MIDGFYTVVFQTPVGLGGGVAHLSNGKMNGGDSILYYIGTYEVEGDRVVASVHIETHMHLPGVSSVFGVPSADLTLSGRIDSGKIVGTGKAAQVPGITMQVAMTRVGG